MNDYVTAVLEAATNPDLADSAATRLSERLSRAGLLVVPSPSSGLRPSAEAVALAGQRASAGRPVSEFVSALAARSADPSVDTVAVFDNALRRAALAEGFSILS